MENSKEIPASTEENLPIEPMPKKAEGKKHGKKKKMWKTLWKITWITGIVILGILLVVFLYFLKDLPSPKKLNQRDVVESTKILDRTGDTVLYEVHGEEKRTQVGLGDIAESMQQAMISAEDKDFYRHIGFDPRGMARSLFRNVADDSRVGGSTITQQLVKNSVLTSEKTYTRKMKELVIAVEVEIRFSKDDILEMYLNEIPFGSNAYGVEAASQAFFGKSASDLTLVESATLASLPKAPTFYSPYGANTDRLLERRNWVLDRMVDDGFITEDEAEAAKALPIKTVERSDGIIAGHFVDLVRAELVELYGERATEQGGLRVVTTLNMDLQHIAERVVPEGIWKNEAEFNATNAALTAIDPKTGEVLAMQGSLDYFDVEREGNVNVAVRERQPGSSFKPIVYAAAFKEGYTPSTMLYDVHTDFGTGYKPNNYDNTFRGPVSMRSAVGTSLNVPAVKTLYLVGMEDALNFADRLGITTLNDPSRYGLSLVLGGGEVKLIDMVSAFSVFANEGQRIPRTTILTVHDTEGNLLLDNRDRDGERVMEEQTARLINDVLSDDGARAPAFGRGSALTLPDRPVAAKTGTTEEYRDAWTIGFTPNLAAGVWAGNNDNAQMRQGAGGWRAAAPIWNAFMREATATMPIEEFTAPAPENTGKAVLDGRIGQETEVRLCKPSMKLATDRCPESQVEMKKFRKAHSILYYLNKEDPRGDAPKNPAEDPQFNSWEGAVRGWAEGQEISMEDPPTEHDDTHDPEDAPKMTITTPSANELIEGDFMTVKVDGTAEHGFRDVRFMIDGAQVAKDLTWPYEAQIPLSGIKAGFHTVTARGTDLIDNAADVSVQVNIRHTDPLTITITSPSPGAGLSGDAFPYTYTAVIGGEVAAKSVTLSIMNASGGGAFSKTISASGSDTVYSTSIPSLDPGSYTARSSATDVQGKTTTSNGVSFTVNP